MDEITIKVFFNNVYHTLNELSRKFFIERKELTEYEQKLLNDMQTLIVHSQHREVIRQHFSIKK